MHESLGMITYSAFLEGLGLAHFSSDEITRLFSRPQQTEPPRKLWSNIVLPLCLLDQLRREMRAPIVIQSTFRAHVYNVSVGGAPGSQHLNNRAVDFSTGNLARAWETLNMWRDAGVFRGGLGLYSTFIHLDTRGENRTWR